MDEIVVHYERAGYGRGCGIRAWVMSEVVV